MSLGADLERIRRKIEGQIDLVAKDSLRILCGRIELSSPVLTGAFRRNWIPSVDAPGTWFTPGGHNPFYGPALPMMNDQLERVLQGFNINQTFYFVNNAPYAERLEYGWSAQASQGIVRYHLPSWDVIVAGRIRSLFS